MRCFANFEEIKCASVWHHHHPGILKGYKVNDRQKGPEYGRIDPHLLRVLLFGVRQGLIIIIGAIEVYLGVERTIVPRHKQREGME